MVFTTAGIVLAIATLLLLILLAIYASGVGSRAHEPDEPVPTGNPSMERKVAVILGVMLVTGIALLGYGFWEPIRQAGATTAQEHRSIERGVENYTSLCISCHGVAGAGAVVPDVEPPRVAPSLDRPDLRPASPDEYKAKYDYIYKTLERGRPGTPMPAWGRNDGGTLIPEQLHELTLMILNGDHGFEGNQTVWQHVADVSREKIAHGTREPIVPELAAAPDLSPEAQAGRRLFQGKGACIGCHNVGGVGGQTGPALSAIGAIAPTRTGQAAEEYIRQSIRQPQSFIVAGYPPVMPAYTETQLSEEEISQLVAWFLTLR